MHGGRSVGATAVKMGTGLAGLALAGTAAVALPGAAGAADLPDGCTSYTPPLASTRVTCEFDSTGAAQTFHVPDGVTELDVTAVGGHGAEGVTADGGIGAKVTGTVDVDEGADLGVYVGADGVGQDGGFNGGGDGATGRSNSGGGGGGASDVRTGPDLTSRLIVAGAGGGGGWKRPGGDAGAAGAGGGGGQAGTQNVGGAGGGIVERGFGDAGTAGSGGNGFSGAYSLAGGGGGGLYGGGGAGYGHDLPGTYASGGGGGGSSLVPEGGTMTLAGEGDAPSVTISYTICTGSVCSMAGSLENLFGSLS